MTIVENFKFGIPLVDLPKYQVTDPIGSKPVEKLDHINYKLLDEMIDFISAHPKTWNQGAWFQQVDTETGEEKYLVRIEKVEELNSCGTSFCLAGHVALHEGFPAPPLQNTQEWERKVDGELYPESVDRFAAKRLGIDSRQAEALFSGSNTLVDLKRMVILLKLDPNISGWVLEEIGAADQDEFLEIVKDHLPVDDDEEDL